MLWQVVRCSGQCAVESRQTCSDPSSAPEANTWKEEEYAAVVTSHEWPVGVERMSLPMSGCDSSCGNGKCGNR